MKHFYLGPVNAREPREYLQEFKLRGARRSNDASSSSFLDCTSEQGRRLLRRSRTQSIFVTKRFDLHG
jgi:hypothetical protein